MSNQVRDVRNCQQIRMANWMPIEGDLFAVQITSRIVDEKRSNTGS